MLSFLVTPLVLCAAVLLVSGIAKLREPAATRDAFVALRLPAALGTSPAPALLPWGEIVLGIWLLVTSGWLLVLGVVGTLGLFAIYLVVIRRALGFEEKVSCNCFGKLGDDGVSTRTLVRNAVLVATATLGLVAAGVGVSVPATLASEPGTTLGWLLMAGLAGAVALFVLGRGKSTPAAGATLVAGGSLPWGTMLDAATGQPVSLQGLGDDRTILLVLSLWCGPCASVMDDLADLRASAPGVRIRPAVTDRVADELRTRSAEVQADALLDPYGNLLNILAPGTPTALLVDGRGVLLADPAVGEGEVRQLIASVGVSNAADVAADGAAEGTTAAAEEQAPSPESDVEDDEDAYARLPIPDAIVIGADGPRTLRELVSQKAALLVSINCLCGTSREASGALDGWRERLPALEVGLLSTLTADAIPDDIRPRAGVLHDHTGLAQRALRMHQSPMAVLLGADGLLAGGPVEGMAEIEAFVSDIEEQLSEAGVEAEPVPAAS